MWLRQLFKRAAHPTCKHERERVVETIEGVTLGWSALPEVSRCWTHTCLTCGRTYKNFGYLPRKVCKTPRDKDDWPLNPNGTRMPIAQH